MKRRYLVLLGALVFVVTLVLHAPAALVYAWSRGAQPPPGAPLLHGVHGTLAHGGFAALSVNQRAVLGDTRWTLQPLWLPLLRLTADVESAGDTVVRLRASRTLFGRLRLANLSAAGSVKALLSVLGQPAWPVEGQARLDLPLVRWAGGVPLEARGTAQIENLTWSQAREPLSLGSFTAELATDDKGIGVTLSSGPGPLEVSGSASLAPDQAYDLHLQLRPRPQATAQLQTLVRSLGTADAQGWYHIRRSGSLAPPPSR